MPLRADRFSRSIRMSLLLLSLLLTSCGSGQAPQAGDVVQVADALLPNVNAAATKHLMTYRMPGISGDLVEATAVVLLPVGTAPAGGWPVIGWGHGARGVADICAPSRSGSLGSYDTYLERYLAAGYAVVAPDLEGLGTAGGHPFLHLDSAGRSVLHAIKAATRRYPELSQRYALVGHSQGGHAAIGAAELANAGEIDGLTLVGVVAIAPISQVRSQSQFLGQVANNPLAPLQDRYNAGVVRIAYSALLFTGVAAVDPTFNAGAIYGSEGAFIADLANSQCLSTLYADLLAPVQTVLGQNNSTEGLLPTSADDHPAVADYLQALEPGFRPISAQVLLLQGELDNTVFPSSTQTLLNLMANQGNQVRLESFQNEGHTSIVAASVNTAIAFISDQFATAAQ